MRTDIVERKDEILKWISNNQSKAFISKQLKCKPETLESYLKQIGIEYKGNKGGRGIKSDKKKKTASEYSQSSCVKSHKLKIKLLDDKLKDHKCEKCGNTEWLDEPIPLELHHVDGNHFNNELINLQLLCPNCHAQCDNNSGKQEKNNFYGRVT